jgi:adenine phosphoribosyltransferase
VLANDLAALIRDVPDFPKPGILFKDITPLLGAPGAIAALADLMAAPWLASTASTASSASGLGGGPRVTKVAGIEARGFLLAPLVADRLGVGMVPIRKPGKLPSKSITRTYNLEYGTDSLQVHADAAGAGDHVLIIDDVLATGGTALAAAGLIGDLGATVAGFGFAIELAFINGRQALAAALGDQLVIETVLSY